MTAGHARSTPHLALDQLLSAITQFSGPIGLTQRISDIERDFVETSREEASGKIDGEKIDRELLHAALTLKGLVSRVNDVVHAVGILISLPHVLEPGEVIKRLSLAAGNTGRPYDLETDRQIAEFKFTEWRGSDSIRQNSLFVDLFNLARADTDRRRVIYLLGKDRPLGFLNGHRSLNSVLSKNAAAAQRFRELYSERYSVVSEYYSSVRDLVEIVDLNDIVPELRPLAI